MPFAGHREIPVTSDADTVTAPSLPDEAPSASATATQQWLTRIGRVSRTANLDSEYRLSSATKPYTRLMERDLNCPTNKIHYSCSSGFVGCCSANPCGRQGCPDNNLNNGLNGNGATSRNSEKYDSTVTETESRTAEIESRTQSSIEDRRTSSVTSTTGPARRRKTTTTTTTSPAEPTINPAPECPQGDDAVYTDGLGIEYRIQCDSDNTFESFESIAVGIGGYGQCFSSCSQSKKCAGFTFVGDENGTCFLKAKMPKDMFADTEGTGGVACAKLNPKAAVTKGDVVGKKEGGRSIGALVGVILGGLAGFALLVFLIAFLARRHRRRVDARRATLTSLGPTLPLNTYIPPYEPMSAYGREAMHQRSPTTGNDVFASFGGNVYAPQPGTHTRQRSVYHDQRGWV